MLFISNILWLEIPSCWQTGALMWVANHLAKFKIDLNIGKKETYFFISPVSLASSSTNCHVCIILHLVVSRQAMGAFPVSHCRGVSILDGQVTLVLQIIGHRLDRSSRRSLLPSCQAGIIVKIIPVLRLARPEVNLWRLWVTPGLRGTLLLVSDILFLHVISRTNMAHIRLCLVVGTLIAHEL